MASTTAHEEESTVLVIDDEKELHYSFRRLLSPLGCEIRSAISRAEALEALSSGPVDLALLDVRLGDENGLDVLKDLLAERPNLPVIVMTAFGTTDTAIEATRQGAYDYVLKPFDPPQFVRLVQEALRTSHAAAHSVALPGDAADEEEESIIGHSPAMQEVYKTIGRVAGSDALVLLLGESGTGKELVARAVYSHGSRRTKRFLPINCAALPESLLESELFGHERGAFSGAVERRLGKFEQAEGGTVFLDEIGELSPATQAKLLRFLQDQTFQRVGGRDLIRTNVRIIAATNQELDELARQGKFRADLLYRLKVVTIDLPPLRKRREDIADLVEYFIKRYAKRPTAVADAAMERLCAGDWPGNVRELENTLRRALLLVRGSTIEPGDIEMGQRAPHTERSASESIETAPESDELGRALDGLWRVILSQPEDERETKTFLWIETELAKRALETTNGNQVQAAKLLGVSRNTLRQRLGL